MPKIVVPIAIILLAATPAHAQQTPHECARDKDFKTQITFDVNIKPTRYNNRKSQKSLTTQGRQSLKAWKKQHEKNVWVSGSSAGSWHTQGVTRGAISMKTRSKFVGKPYDEFGKYYCPYVKDITVTIDYQSEIYVASDFKKGTCMHREILAHEERHHDTNVDVVKTLSKKMKANMPRLITTMEGNYVKKDNINQRFDRLKEGASSALDTYLEEINARRDEFNALVDSPEEYKRMSNICR